MKLIDIPFEDNEKDLIKMQDIFNSFQSDALYMSHYDLAARSKGEFSPIDWRVFLNDYRVVEFLEEELNMIQRNAIMKMMKDIDQSKSTGQAQLLNTLVQQSTKNKSKDGPVFIYTYIPLSEQEEAAPNVEKLQSDPFKIRN